jgi:hypothetical protein
MQIMVEPSTVRTSTLGMKVTGQPSTVVVRPAVAFGHGRLLEEVGELWNLPFVILVAP